MKKPLVSVIVICYNHEKYIRDCLDGILMQKTDFPIEIIVGDDCSTDNTLSIIHEYKQKYPEIITAVSSDKNLWSQGVSMTYTLLCPHAKGKYLAFCEGDDYWINPMKLQFQADFLERNPDYSMCFHDYMINDGKGEFRHRYCLKKECDAKLSGMINLNACQTATIFERREIIDYPAFKAFLNDRKRGYGDINNFMSCYANGKIRHLQGTWSVYRRHDDSVTATDDKDGGKTAIQKHLRGIRCLIRHYGLGYSYLLRNFRSIRLLGLSSELIARRRHLSGIMLKIAAFVLSPCFVSRLYLQKVQSISI